MKKVKYFSIMYFLLFAGINISTTYGNLYFKEIGLTGGHISIIVSTSALITIISQPLLGKIGEKIENQVNLLKVIIIFSGIFFVLIGLKKNFIYIVIFNLCFSFFHYSLQPMLANISLEYVSKIQGNYGYIRSFGTVGFCISSVLFGLYGDYDSIFIVFAVISTLSFLVTLKLPKFKNQKKQVRRKLQLSKREVKLILAACLLNITYGVYFNFFGIYFTKELGGSLKLFGFLSAISTLAEIPFLFFWKNIKNRYSEEKIIIIVGLIGFVRWTLTLIVVSPLVQIFVQALHGAGFVVILTVMTTYISNNMYDDNKIIGQTLYAMITLISSKIVGGVIGGFVGDILGYKKIFVLLAIINILVIFICQKNIKQKILNK